MKSNALIAVCEQLLRIKVGDKSRIKTIKSRAEHGRVTHQLDLKYIDKLIQFYKLTPEFETKNKKIMPNSIQKPLEETNTEFCGNCGVKINVNDNFCRKCGMQRDASQNENYNTSRIQQKTGIQRDASQNENYNTSGIQQKTGIQIYQILSIIGGVIGLLVTVAYAILTSLVDSFAISFGGEGFGSAFHEYFVIAMPLAIIIYVSCFVVPFIIKKTKIVGIYLIICSFVVLIATAYIGLAGFALLLPAGILALRHKS